MTATLAFKLASGTLALLALLCAGVAARRSYQAAGVSSYPDWTPLGLPGRSEPVDPAMRQVDLELAALMASKSSGDFNRAAVWWTIRAVILGTAANLVSLFPLSN
ncbi:hypothetical protein [Methylobacterium pseudosasicola]|uniref:hypothetical protein n=1 Tax=Methylobacterium pseudosasicola TaxID=582667 RepID=UPI00111423C7|nr:hypothetical protein [Methylobacterium pseudosasicola]